MDENITILPAGHKWKEVNSATASETWFQCTKCKATFIHDMMDDSVEFDEETPECTKSRKP